MNAYSPIYVDESRYNLYAMIHKGLRRAQTQLLARIGSVNPLDDALVAAIIKDMRLLNRMGRKHLVHENTYIHEVVEERISGATDRLADDHDHHERDFDELDQMLNTLEVAIPTRRSSILRAVYLRYTQFLAEDFQHMLEEETETLALLHKIFDDQELAGMEGRIVGSIQPELLMEYLKIMFPAMNPAERTVMLGGMKAHMPAEMFTAIVETTVKPVLEPSDWRWLENALSIAA